MEPAPTAEPQLTQPVDLTSASWSPGEYDRFMAQQGVDRTQAGAAQGFNGAVTVAYNAYAARAGLEALKQGGNAIDAAMTGALAQVALTAGAPVSYFGIMSLVYYDAKSGQIHTMNAEWNTVKGETDPASIPGGLDLTSTQARKGKGPPSGRTALVGGFMKGVESAHRKFGKLPFSALFQPSIELAEKGMPVTDLLDWSFAFREEDLGRLPETKAIYFKTDGKRYHKGDTFRQPQLAETLRRVASEGADYMYNGPWGQKLVDVIQAEGGYMTLDDLKNYEVHWADPIIADIGNGYSVAVAPWPNAGGVALIEAQNLADVAGLTTGPHWTKSSDALRKALEVSQFFLLSFFSPEQAAQHFPGVDFSPEARTTRGNAEALWNSIKDGSPLKWKRNGPMHSDDIVAIDAEGNIAAITHTINCVMWGKTTIHIDGISIGDPGAFQQPLIARVPAGSRLLSPTETGILMKDGVPVLGFASMGAGLHQRTFQALLNYTRFGMTVEEAINTADFYFPTIDPVTGDITAAFPVDGFDHDILDGTGLAWREVPLDEARLGGEGKWVAIERDPETGLLSAASHNRNNSDAVAY
ncbi:MAG: gamma-glutamyltransferase [Bradyrhizobium sp.]|nr:gamma-glutamyltransferase [Bradyrhizobium sp.]